MADTKISALPTSTTPLAGTETLPIVQGGATKKASVASLTEGRTVSDAVHLTGTATRNTTYNPNLQVQGTAGDGSQGILVESYKPSITFFDFSGGTPAVQRIANDSGYLYFEQDTNQDGTFDQVNVWVTPAGNIGFASGKGIDFSAAGGTVLDDYEEGTYTTTMTPGTSGTITLGTYFTLAYTKIGRQVTITGVVIPTSSSSPVGDYVDIDLPFAVADLTGLSERFSCGGAWYNGGASPGAEPRLARVYSTAGATTARVYQVLGTFANDSRCSWGFSFSYFAA